MFYTIYIPYNTKILIWKGKNKILNKNCTKIYLISEKKKI